MKPLRLYLPFFLLMVLISACSFQSGAQTKQTELVKGSNISATMKKGEKHQYFVRLNEKQFAFLRLVQDGIDVTIAVNDPSGKKIGEFDSPNGKNGPEPITFNSDKKGNYVLEVWPTDEEETGGKYVIGIVKTEPLGTTPGKKMDQLFAPWDNPETPGAAVAVVKEGKIIFKKGYGSANLEYSIPITPSSVFHIASVSKQFTAFSILLLAKEGKLSLDDDIRKYIPEVPDFGKIITLRQLAHHTSGLRDQWSLLVMAGWRLDDVITKEHILKLVSRQKELNYNPGDEFLYCNTGFTLLAEVVARVSGKTFAEFTRERIFEPLKMYHTLFYDDHEKIVKNRAYSYQMDSTGFKKSVLSYANVGATSLFTTAEDLCLWAMNFEKPVVGDMGIINEMNKRGILNKGDTISYALGQDVSKYKRLNLIAHSGGDAGYRTFLGRFPDQRFSVIVLSNNAAFNPAGLALKVADIYLKDKLETPKEKVVPVAVVSENQPVEVDPEILKSYCGQYELRPGLVVTVTMEDKKLYAEVPGQSKILLEPASSSEFKIKGTDGKATFIREDSSKFSKLKVILDGQELIAPKMKDFDPASVNLTEFTGEFFSSELSTTYTITAEGGKLIVRHQRVSNFKLTPVKPDYFAGGVWFFGQVEFVRDDQKNISGCRVSNGRVRNLWFEKVNK
jgi:CubicO group peptidase (beta-lactamase class C family)